uniref:CCHC-type domain-containing protein n=1 Tax=Tanacetum cinerariifolium TaxID=118510 RepID=A0A6L2J1R1_TANCI|nr:hypothetical protein [Tanacetum cinerariifolium]
MEAQPEIIQNISSLKLPMLKTGDYDLWNMRMEQYLTHTDYALWKVIINGDSHVHEPPAVVTVVRPKTEAQKLARKNKLKAKSTLLLAIPDEHLLKFHSIKDANINETVTTAHDIPAAGSKEQPSASSYADDVMFSFFASQSNTPQLDNEDLEQIGTSDLEEIDLKWQVAIITIRVKKFMKRTRRNLKFNGKEPVGFDKTKVKCYNCYRRGHFARECHAPRNQDNRSADNERRVIPVETPASALVVQDGLGGYDWSYQAEKGPTDFALIAHSSYSANSSNSEGKGTGQREVRPVWNNARRLNHQNFSKMTHPHPKRNFVPTAVVTKLGPVLVNAAKQNSAASTSTARPKVNTATIRPNVNAKSSYFKPNFPKKMHFNQRSVAKTNTFLRKINIAKGKNVTTAGPKAVVNAIEEKKKNVVKSSACWIWSYCCSVDVDLVSLMRRTGFRTRDEVKYHLLQKGFMHGYTTWWEHGETEDTFHHVGQCSNTMEDDEVDATTHIELNNIYPIDYNLGSSSEEEEVQDEEVPNEFAQRFYRFNDNDIPFMLPKDNKLVENFYKAKKCSKEISLPIKKIYACKKHCMLFYDADASLTHCRWYGTSRYKSGGRKVPNLVLTYMPIADRLQLLYMSKTTTKDMKWHADYKTADGSMVHPSDGTAWKHLDLEVHYLCMKSAMHTLDVMHIEKNVFENIFILRKQNNKVLKTKASYTLSKPHINKVCEWLKNVKFPDGYASNVGGCVNLNDYSFYSFKSHECHVFMQRLLPIALKGMIPNTIWDAITELCTFFRVICSKELHIEDLKTLKDNIVVTLCKLEKVFPPGFFDSMEHLVIHLVNEAINGVPRNTGGCISMREQLETEQGPRALLLRPIAVTNNTEVCVKGSCYNEEESDYYGELEEVIEAIVKAMPRGILQVKEGTTEDIQQVTLVREEIEEVQTALITDDTDDDDGKEEEFEYINGDDDSSDAIDLDSFNHSSDEDDCIPKGKGSNNTSGNGRDISNDYSLRGRGSSSIGGRGNESADEWCSSPHILGDERLVVHEDNEEHAVGSSQN